LPLTPSLPENGFGAYLSVKEMKDCEIRNS